VLLALALSMCAPLAPAAGLYVPGTQDGQVLSRSEFDRIATAVDAVEALTKRVYGGMRMDLGNSHPMTLTATPAEVVGWDTAGQLSGIAVDTAGGTLTVTADGVFDFWCVVTIEGAQNGVAYTLEARINNASAGAIPADAPAFLATNVVIHVGSIPVALSAGDRVSLYLSADSDHSVTLTRVAMRLIGLD